MFLRLAAVFLVILPAFSSALDVPPSTSFEGAATSLSSRLEETAAARGRLRTAVLEFTPLQAEYSGKNALGAAFAAKACEFLSGSKTVKLYERTRLDRILAEQKLSLSGIVSSDDALKLGEIAPVDALVSGTWTRLSGSVEVQVRAVDVATGSVLFSLSLKFAEDPDVRALLGKASDSDPCAAAFRELSNRLADLSTGEKISNAVAWLVRYDPKGECGQVHLAGARRFMDYSIQSDRYRSFCLAAITNIPARRSETHFAMAHYLTVDGTTDPEEWQAVLTAVPYLTEPMYYGDAFRPFLFPKADGVYDTPLTDAGRNEVARLRKAFFERVKSPGFGLPVRIDADAAFLAFYNAVNICPDNRVFLDFLTNQKAGLKKATRARYGDVLKYRFRKETAPELKKLLALEAAQNALDRDDGQNVYDLWQFAEICEKEGGEAWKVFLEKARPAMEKLYPGYSKINGEVTNFAARSGVKLR